MTKKEEARKLYCQGKSLREIAELTGRRESRIRADCVGIVIQEPPAEKAMHAAFWKNFPEEWERTCRQFRLEAQLHDARKGHKMLRLDKIRRLSIAQITDILLELDIAALRKLMGCQVPDRWERMPQEERRRYISEWLMEEA